MRLPILTIIVLSLTFASAICKPASQEGSGAFTSFSWLEDDACYAFEAWQSSRCSDIVTQKADPNNSITRKLKGVVAKDGRFKYEIINTGGPDIGVNWVIAFDGKLTYIYESFKGVNNVYIKRGLSPEDPFLARVDPILLPFMFLKETALLPGDMGTYVSVKDLIAAQGFNDLINKSVKSEENDITILIHRKVESFDKKHYALSISFDKTTSLPKIIKFDSLTGDESQIQDISWEKWGYGFLLPVNAKTTLLSAHQGLTCNFESKLLSFEIIKSHDENIFKIDLSNVDHIVDRDENIIIPLKQK